jgi:hypothetical protein
MKAQTNKNNIYTSILFIAKEGASKKRDCRSSFNLGSAAKTFNCRTGRPRHAAPRFKKEHIFYDRQGAYFSSKEGSRECLEPIPKMHLSKLSLNKP